MKVLKNYREAIKFLVIYYIVGLIGFWIPAARDFFLLLIPISILITLTIVIAFYRGVNFKLITGFILIAIAGFFIEAAGVKTGRVFGTYVYTHILGPKIFNTPIIIGFNWLLLSLCTWELARKFKSKWLPPIVKGAIFMTAIDVLMEPVAIKTKMWIWPDGITLQNYLAWFVSSLFMMLILSVTVKKESKTAIPALVAIVLFFLLLNFIL